MFAWQTAEVMHPDEDGIISALVEPQPLDSTPDADSESIATTPSVVVPDVGTHEGVAVEGSSSCKGVKDATQTQSFDNAASRASTSSSPALSFRSDSTHDEGSTPSLSESSIPPADTRMDSEDVLNFDPELMQDGAAQDLAIIDDFTASVEAVVVLEESFACRPGVEQSCESLPHKPYTTKSTDAGEMPLDVGDASGRASWARPLQQQMAFIALSSECEMQSAPDPFSVLDHRVNSCKL